MKSLKLCALTLSASLALLAEAIPSKIFADHAVLHQSKNTPVFGKANPGEDVTVTIAGKKATTKANAEGKWLVRLDISNVGHGPFTMTVNDKTYKDILVGEVWLCSGQSNMEFRLHSCEGAKEEIAASQNNLFRCFTAPARPSEKLLDEINGYWTIAGPKTSGGFTGVGYYFGKKIQQELNVPVALIHVSKGASSLEAWMPREYIQKDPKLAQILKPLDEFYSDYPKVVQTYQQKRNEWEVKYNRADRPHKGVPADGWAPLKDGKLPINAGAVWLRRTVTIKDNQVGKVLEAMLNHFLSRGYCLTSTTIEVYWNGQKIEPSYREGLNSQNQSFYRIPAKLTAQKQNTLALRLFNSLHHDTLFTQFRLGWPAFGDKGWEASVEFKLPGLTKEASQSRPPRTPPFFSMKYPCGLYNQLIHPILPLGISGVIWYQGESNSNRPEEHEYEFPQFIKIWREIFQKPNLPFYWCQLANYKRKNNNPNITKTWAELRDSQTKTLKLPHTGQAVLIDVGEAYDIHPRDKKTPGERLAAIALSETYGRKRPHTGPMFSKATVEGSAMRIAFTDLHGGLVAKPIPKTYVGGTLKNNYPELKRNAPNSQLEGFAICGEDNVWHWADASIDGDTVLVSSPNVKKPVAVKYAWEDNPTVNLYNQAGFPAVPFSTLR